MFQSFGCLALASTLHIKPSSPLALQAASSLGILQTSKGTSYMNYQANEFSFRAMLSSMNTSYPSSKLLLHEGISPSTLLYCLEPTILKMSIHRFERQQTSHLTTTSRNNQLQSISTVKRSDRSRRLPSYLCDFHCSLLTETSPLLTTKEHNTKHPLLNHLSYDNLTNTQRCFLYISNTT